MRMLQQSVNYYLAGYYMQRSGKLAVGQQVLLDRSSIKEFVAANNPAFNQRIERVFKKQLDPIKESGVFQLAQKPTPNIFFFRADLYNSDRQEDIEDYMLRQVNNFYTNSDLTYAIAYMHSSFVDFLVFRRFLERWPEHFFHRLRRVYIVGASIVVKIIEVFSIGTFYRLCDELFMNLSDDEDLGPTDQQVLKALGQPLTPTARPSKASIRIIEDGLYGKLITEYDLYSGKYPRVMLLALRRLVQKPQQLRCQGIFRKNCNSEELERLEKQVRQRENNLENETSKERQEKSSDPIFRQDDVLVVCGLLKKVLTNLKEPLFSFAIYDKTAANFNNATMDELARSVYKEMGYVNQKVFVLLYSFLTDYVAAQAEYNHMPFKNLSIVFSPCCFRPQVYSFLDMKNAALFGSLLLHFFEYQQTIFPVQERELAKAILEQLRNDSLPL